MIPLFCMLLLGVAQGLQLHPSWSAETMVVGEAGNGMTPMPVNVMPQFRGGMTDRAAGGFGTYKVDPFVGSAHPQGSLSFDMAAPQVQNSPLMNKRYRDAIMSPLPGMPGGSMASGSGSR